jgi:hypothetical protein
VLPQRIGPFRPAAACQSTQTLVIACAMSVPPSEIVCPLTNQVFVDPVIASDGHTYERAAITNLVARGQQSPVDGSVLEKRFFPNVMLRQKAAEWMAQQNASGVAVPSGARPPATSGAYAFAAAALVQQPPGSTVNISLASDKQLHHNIAESATSAPDRAGPVAIAQTGVDNDKISRLAATAQASRLGGKGSIRRKHGPVHKIHSSAQDDRRLHQFLMRFNMNVSQGECLHVLSVDFALLICHKMSHLAFAAGIDEVKMFMDDDTVIHFINPTVQMSTAANTFVVSGNCMWTQAEDPPPAPPSPISRFVPVPRIITSSSTSYVHPMTMPHQAH